MNYSDSIRCIGGFLITCRVRRDRSRQGLDGAPIRNYRLAR
jgi:hypothetical protein